MAKFNERLKQLRTEASLSQQEFATAISLSKSSVNMYERGEREPGIATLECIADYFNVDMDYLVGRSDHKNKTAWYLSLNDDQKNVFKNIILLAGRDGSLTEHHLTDEQIDLFKRMIEQMPEFKD